MRHFLSAIFLSVIALLLGCGNRSDPTHEVSGQSSTRAIATQSSPAQPTSPSPVEQEKIDSTSNPPSTFKDEGACPFEGCVYRQWKAEKTTAIHEQPDSNSPALFSIQPGEWVTAITGFVLTSEPGMLEFTGNVETPELKSFQGSKVSLYTYQGEGSYKAWFNGRFFDLGASDLNPSDVGKIKLIEPKSTWWVRIRNRENQEGWTSEGLMRFSNIDQFGGPDLSPSTTIPQ